MLVPVMSASHVGADSWLPPRLMRQSDCWKSKTSLWAYQVDSLYALEDSLFIWRPSQCVSVQGDEVIAQGQRLSDITTPLDGVCFHAYQLIVLVHNHSVQFPLHHCTHVACAGKCCCCCVYYYNIVMITTLTVVLLLFFLFFFYIIIIIMLLL